MALGAFGLAVGALDASMNMLGVSLQRAYGRSIMLGFHAAYSLGGIAGASIAWAGAHWDLSLFVLVSAGGAWCCCRRRWWGAGGTSMPDAARR